MVSTKFEVDTKMDRGSMVVSGEPYRITRNGRRYFGKSHKEAVLAKCMAPGASLAAVALANGFNANLVRKWVRERQAAGKSGAKLVPVVIEPQRRGRLPESAAVRLAKPAECGSIEIRMGATEVVVRGVVNLDRLSVVLEALSRSR